MMFYKNAATKDNAWHLMGPISGEPDVSGMEKLPENVMPPGLPEAIQTMMHEHHLPVVTYENGVVRIQVGSVLHDMTEAHHLQWFFVHTTYGATYFNLSVGDQPVVEVPCQLEEVLGVYVLCNQHGLWKVEGPF